ncbi:MAG TPA: Stp1/IreP family PP2C-type Ser/Thr phosphatase [Acidimicrobiales bacterium]|nr:Stp1/IreP family PP2C-type Ser/Thr phosphatase [Acidimicrobiales bacterium]
MTVLRSGSATDVGRVRSSNQDLALEETNLFAVADGMGGHVGGEVAARVAVDALRGAFARQPSIDGLRQAVVEANSAVWQRGQAENELRGMGTTMTAVALVAGADGRDVIALANVGDSRAYVSSGDRLVQITSDHSLAEEKVRHGELTEAEAAVHPHRHILTRALGVAAEVDVDLWELRLHDGDRLLLCSDGLTNEVGVDRIAQILIEIPDPAEAARGLVRAALDHGGNDNITVVVVDVLVGDRPAGTGTDPVPKDPAPADLAAADLAAAGAGAATILGDFDQASGQLNDPAVTGPPPVAPIDEPVTGTVQAITPATPDRVAAPALPPLATPGGPGRTMEDAGGEQTNRRQRRRERRQDRRRAGIPRRLTFRVGLFVALLLAVLAAAYGFLRWYATDNWYVTVDGKHLVVYQGRPGGLLWFQPKLVDRTSVTTAGVLPTRVPSLAADVNEPSLARARGYVANLHQEYLSQKRIDRGPAPGTTTTTTTTVPGATTTVPGQSATTLVGQAPTAATTTVPTTVP